MKNVYASIALAAAVCGTASAAVVQTNSVKSVESMNTVAEMPAPYAPIEKSTEIMRAAAPATDAAGFYVYNWYGRTQSTSGLQTTGVELTIDADNNVTIMGLWNLAVVKGTYDPAKGTLRIPSGQPTLYIGERGTNIKFFADELIIADNKITGERELPYLELEYLPQGAQTQDGQTILVGGWYTDPKNQISFNEDAFRGTDSGYSWQYAIQLYSPVEFYNMPGFVYNEAEWTDCGNAKLDDGWFRALSSDGKGFAAYDVNCKINKNDKNLILLVNPYGASSPYAGISPEGVPFNKTPNMAGYLLLNIADPECVLVQPFVNSGFSITNVYGFRENESSTEVTYPTEGYFACTTAEGQRYYMEGWTTDEIKEEADIYGDPLPTLENTTVTLPNCRVQNPSDGYLTPSQWLAQGGKPIPMETQIILPAAALAGVEGVINDTENAAKRYFNLQGLEIANPAAGELVIVKQGNKTTKTIVK